MHGMLPAPCVHIRLWLWVVSLNAMLMYTSVLESSKPVAAKVKQPLCAARVTSWLEAVGCPLL